MVSISLFYIRGYNETSALQQGRIKANDFFRRNNRKENRGVGILTQNVECLPDLYRCKYYNKACKY